MLPFSAKTGVPLGGGHCSSPLALHHVCILRRRSSEWGFWCPVFWSSKFPIGRCPWGWKLWSAEGAIMPVCGSVELLGLHDSQLVRLRPWLDWGYPWTWLSRVGTLSPFLMDCWTLLSIWALGDCVVALGEFSGFWWVLPVWYAVRLPSSFAILLIGLNYMYRLSMLIWSFYSKTYIIIPTCTYEIWWLRPVLPSLTCLSPTCKNWWAACGWLPGVRPGSVREYSHWEKCLEWVSGGLGVGLNHMYR